MTAKKNDTKIIKRWGKGIAFLVIMFLAICGVSYVLSPKIPDFYEEDSWDVVFFGTSQTYCTFDPAVFDEYGLKTYNRGRSQQPMDYTYYYVKDALEVSDIDVVVLEIFGMNYGADDTRHVEEGVRDSSLNDFRYSSVKMEAILDCVPEDKQVSYLFPLDKYHSNWEQLDYSSPGNLIKDLTTRTYKEESERGFWGWTASEACGYLSWEEIYSETRGDVWDENMEYLERIYELCQENGSRLILVRAPFPCSEATVQLTNTVGDWAQAHDVELINYMKLTDAIGLDFGADSLDGGTHLNVYGADKVSRHMAEYLCSD
jgi:hypothetical protein